MEKMKHAITKSLTAKMDGGSEPTEQEVGEAIIELIEGIAGIANSLARIADNTERLAECVETRAGDFGNYSSFRTI